MSATLFLAFCILGCDFLLYVLFQWTYGEKHRGLARRSARPEKIVNQQGGRPFVVASRKGTTKGEYYLQSSRKLSVKEGPVDSDLDTEERYPGDSSSERHDRKQSDASAA